MTLTPRQRQVVALISDGASYSRIARTLGITERTVRMHVKDIDSQLDGTGGDTPLRRVLKHSAKLLAT